MANEASVVDPDRVLERERWMSAGWKARVERRVVVAHPDADAQKWYMAGWTAADRKLREAGRAGV